MVKIKKIVLIAIILTGQLITINNIASSSSNNKNKYNNMFVLGDSLSDTGAFVQYQGRSNDRIIDSVYPDCDLNVGSMPPNRLGTRPCRKLIKEWIPKFFGSPFDKNFFSNGPVAAKVVADFLGIKNFKSASYQTERFDNFGYNYATGTAKILNSQDLLYFEFKLQLRAFLLKSDNYSLTEQINKLKYHHQNITKKDLLIINIGSNDLAEIVDGLLFLDIDFWKDSLLNRLAKVVDTLFLEINNLIDYGFNHIIIFNAINFGQIPKYVADLSAIEVIDKTVKKYNDLFDLKYDLLLQNVKSKNKVKKFDFNKAFHDILYDYKLNDKVITKAATLMNWTNSFLFEESFTPYFIGDANEQNVNDYAFLDEVHPTSVFHYDLGKKLYDFVNCQWTDN